MIEAKNNKELLSKLSKIKINKPPKNKSLKNEHAEKYCLLKILSTLAKSNKIIYPLQILDRDGDKKRERPDFLYISGNHHIGIEHTQAVPENKIKEDIFRKKLGKNEVHAISEYHPTDKRMGKKLLINKIENNNSSQASLNDSIEINWSSVMRYFIAKKENNTLKKGYKLFDKNWLIIHDNWTPKVSRNIDLGLKYLLGELISYKHNFDFDCTYILSNDILLIISNNKCEKIQVNNLWQCS